MVLCDIVANNINVELHDARVLILMLTVDRRNSKGGSDDRSVRACSGAWTTMSNRGDRAVALFPLVTDTAVTLWLFTCKWYIDCTNLHELILKVLIYSAPLQTFYVTVFVLHESETTVLYVYFVSCVDCQFYIVSIFVIAVFDCYWNTASRELK